MGDKVSLARDLVVLEEKLRDSGIELFVPIEKGGLLESAEVRSVAFRVESLCLRDPIQMIRLCLQALRVQHDEFKPRLIDAELVATLPPGVPGIARPTSQVLQEMLRPLIREVILLGYEITDRDVMKLLAGATSRGAEVIMICDRERGAAQRVLEGWPPNLRRPRIFHDRKWPEKSAFASIHAKCLLVEGSDLLITSANFTFHGLHGNVEVGVRLSGPPAAEARKIFSHLVESGIVEEVC